jgi:hypothetical protein
MELSGRYRATAFNHMRGGAQGLLSQPGAGHMEPVLYLADGDAGGLGASATNKKLGKRQRKKGKPEIMCVHHHAH